MLVAVYTQKQFFIFCSCFFLSLSLCFVLSFLEREAFWLDALCNDVFVLWFRFCWYRPFEMMKVKKKIKIINKIVNHIAPFPVKWKTIAVTIYMKWCVSFSFFSFYHFVFDFIEKWHLWYFLFPKNPTPKVSTRT